jgi:hypothetical protein
MISACREETKFGSDRFEQIQQENNIMAFVNEYVSEEDIKTYGLKEIDKRYFRGDYKTEWTRDRARDFYLRFMRHGGEDGVSQQTFVFYWMGNLMEVGVTFQGGGMRDGKRWKWWTLRYLSIPTELESHREEILKDLREALKVYGVAGLVVSSADCTITCEF